MREVTRRRLLTSFGAAGAGALLGRIPIDGAAFAKPTPAPHQPGIATPAQARLELAAFDLTAAGRGELRDLMRAWSATAERLSRRHRDAHLTVTFGFGPALFDHRYGLSSKRPAPLETLPAFPGDQLDPAICGGDLAVQVCADRRLGVHVLEELRAQAAGAATERWSIAGSIDTRHGTPRNRMGFKDGTSNVAGDDPTAMRHSVWVGGRDEPAWLRGGSYLVARRIRMRLDRWNATPVHTQEQVIGRHKRSGAPLGARHEFDPADFDAGVEAGHPKIPADAHIRLASPQANRGKLLLRRSYNYAGGLMFLAYMRHPRQFVAIQRRLGEHDDALGAFVVPEGSALFACPPAAGRRGFVGDTLLVR